MKQKNRGLEPKTEYFCLKKIYNRFPVNLRTSLQMKDSHQETHFFFYRYRQRKHVSMKANKFSLAKFYQPNLRFDGLLSDLKFCY